MKFKIGDHLQEIDTPYHGYVVDRDEGSRSGAWYLLENDEMKLVNHWVPESNLELHKQPLRDLKIEQLGIK
jgi:heat shock protein HspQ